MIKKTLLIVILLISNNLINLTTTFSIFNQQQSSNRFIINWGLSARIGKRPTMEDAHQHIIPLHNGNDNAEKDKDASHLTITELRARYKSVKDERFC